MTDIIGQKLGQYEILEQIAKGGMATVYRARQGSMGRDVAIKILPRNFTHDETFIERFNREVEIIAQLQHPHILPVHDFGQFDDMPYIVMAYMRGGTLEDRMKSGAMNVNEIKRVAKQIGLALDFAHSKNIIHRDFKPANVLLDELGNTYLADFGLAKLTEVASNITGMSILGTPTFMSPEQTEPGELTSAVDIYGFAVALYQMLTGKLPFDAPTASGILMAHLLNPVPQVHDLRPDMPDAVQAVLEKGLAKKPEDRYKTAGAMVTDLEEALEGRKPPVTETGELETLTALLMTNMLGRVIFVDNQCLRILKRHHNEARNIIGKPMHEVLGIPQSIADQIMADIGEHGQLNEMVMEVNDAKGRPRKVVCSAVGTRDDDGKFVGADITLELIQEAAVNPADDSFHTVEHTIDSREEDFLQAYFKVQIGALYELVKNWAGKKVARNLEDLINETGQRNVWPVTMKDGYITVQLKRSDTDIYRALLARGMSYAASIIGENQVIKELHRVNKKTDPAILRYVQTLGLDEYFEDVLRK